MIHLSQKALIINNVGLLLTMRRSHTDPHRPLTWDLPGGEVKEGEDLRESILREITEEVGIDVSDLRVADAIGAYNKRGEYWVTVAYMAKAMSDVVTLSYEHDQFEWLTKEQFLSRESSKAMVAMVDDLLK